MGIWPTSSQSRDRPVTCDMDRIEKMNRANQILTLGNLIQKTPRAGLVRKGAETATVPGGRVEATKSQNHMQAKVMKKQKLWVNRKLPGSKQRVKQMPRAGEHLAVRWWREQQSPELLWLPTTPPCVYLTPHPPSSDGLSESGFRNPRNKI